MDSSFIEKDAFEKARRENPLLAVVRNFTGRQGQGATLVKFHCPFHNERTPSFYVDTRKETWRCYGACNCGGDVIDFIQMWMNRSITKGSVNRVPVGDGSDKTRPDPNDPRMKALEMLTGTDFQKKLADERKRYQEQEKCRSAPKAAIKPPSAEQIKRWHDNRATTAAYFVGQRGLTEATVEARLLGTNNEYGHRYEFSDGTKVFHQCRRYVIPWVMGGQPYMTNNRRDDADCKKRLTTMEPEFLYKVRLDMTMGDKLAAEQISDDELIAALFGGKYKRNFGGTGTIFNLDRLFRFENGKLLRTPKGLPVVRQLQYVFINEAEISAISLEELGYNAVAATAKQGIDLKYAFSGVQVPIILADNDGGTGLKKAHSLAEMIGNPDTRVVTIPSPFKDANELTAFDRRFCASNMKKFAEYLQIAAPKLAA